MRTRRSVRFWNIKVLIVFLKTGPIYWVSPKSFIVTKTGIESVCETAYIVMPIDKKNANTDTTTINLRRRFFCSVNSEHFSRKFCWRIFSCNTSTLVACPHNNWLYRSRPDPAYNRRAVKKNATAFFRLIEIMARNNWLFRCRLRTFVMWFLTEC